ncbi:ferric reductase-like transmembrane domain-containing protein [Hanstruepera ponticola]|uniref:ferric reductase-like transmembrane domain-containing protein n=1 Tax=Hanstruepera ponticola TaxID=2042995 RepID=UPI00177D536A|nr:ferric reductase-like transmembrane domain-containing protein [Hanstruepera ponticola]
MRIILTILIALHGVIHLFGFLKAFGISEFNAISHPISKIFGLVWLLTFVLFATTAVLLIAQSNYWWIIGIVGVILSQLLIINYWSDAKFGTIANVIILLATVIGYSSFNFKEKIKEERITLFENSQPKNQEILTEETLLDLPPIVQKWLTNSGIIGKQLISNVYLTQELQLKLKPEQTSWSNGTAEQYFTVQPPAFNWNINTEMNAILSVAGRDKFKDGKGEMTIKLLSLIPVANAKNDEKVNQATLQRYLAEIVWFPSASMSKYIKWETIDDNSARATMEYKGTKGSGVFHFDINGNFEKFVAMRYQDSNNDQPTKWTVTATKTEERNGIKIPVECEASWELESGKWTWLKLKITDIQYNVVEMPVANNNYNSFGKG